MSPLCNPPLWLALPVAALVMPGAAPMSGMAAGSLQPTADNVRADPGRAA
ncbi:hypothetical protein [Paracoccus sp. Ld10]